MNDLLTPKVCLCKTVMRRTGSGYFICPNCDTVQDIERTTVNGRPGQRRTTREDRLFHLAWEERKRTIYGK
ncbi:hypothetical protein NS183_07820 [Microbacterium testaceum]|uniref:hypothetical protein n=1 Tax=Microbacterium testaceum TaxID=2033 RepID=UPI0007341513|nr:hypothetical protein [Microbacterium testaceum]KTS90682.1 hypothetical protein NS183_07820 [Microbacterium testaceum]